MHTAYWHKSDFSAVMCLNRQVDSLVSRLRKTMQWESLSITFGNERPPHSIYLFRSAAANMILYTWFLLKSCVSQSQSVTCLATADPEVVSEPHPAPYFGGDWSWNNFYSHSPPFRLMNQSRRIVVSYEWKYVHKVLVNGLFKLAQKKYMKSLVLTLTSRKGWD